MPATDEAIDALKAQLDNIDSEIERMTAEIKDLKRIRRKLVSTLGALENL